MSDPQTCKNGGTEALKVKQEPVDDTNFSSDAFESGADTADSNDRMEDDSNSNPADNEKDTGNEGADLTLEQLIIENKRLQGVFKMLNQRQTILEEFIEVEHGDKFDTFMKNRERLVNVMGLHPNENDGLDGRRSANSMELVKLLKVVKEQAVKNSGPAEPSSSSNVPQYRHVNRGGGGGGRGRGKNNRRWN